MKKGWINRQISDFCLVTDFVANGSFAALRENVEYLDSHGYAILVRLTDSTKGWNGNYKYISESAYHFLKKSSLFPGDLVMSNVGEPGKVFVVPKLEMPMTLGPNSILIRCNYESCSNLFLFYYFSSDLGRSEIDNISEGVAQKKFNKTAFRSLLLPLPPLPEQKRIVAILDEAFDAIATAKANAEKNLQNARALFDSHLSAVFSQRGEGWKQKTLEEIATTFGRGKSRHRPRNAPHLYGGKYPFVQTGDIRNADHTITEYSQTYSEAGLAQSKLWPKGTICITIAANIAETAILGFDACFPDSVIGVVANPKEAEVGFIEYLLQSFKTSIQAMGKGSAQANINMGTFENERFPFPSVADQKHVVATLDDLRAETQRLESLYQRKLAALDDLKKSLLHQAFSGQLTRDKG
jgi:type I restriction enzyme S subunit